MSINALNTDVRAHWNAMTDIIRALMLLLVPASQTCAFSEGAPVCFPLQEVYDSAQVVGVAEMKSFVFVPKPSSCTATFELVELWKGESVGSLVTVSDCMARELKVDQRYLIFVESEHLRPGAGTATTTEESTRFDSVTTWRVEGAAVKLPSNGLMACLGSGSASVDLTDVKDFLVKRKWRLPHEH